MAATFRLTALCSLMLAAAAFGEAQPPETPARSEAELARELEEIAEAMALQARLLQAAERRAAEAESRAADAERRAAEAERRAAEAESRVMDSERRAFDAESRAADAERLAMELTWPTGPSDEDFAYAIERATRYRRPDRTRESSLDDGSHYDQSSDDRSYQEPCRGMSDPEIVGFRYEIRSNTETLHWRWKQTTGGAWRAYYDGRELDAQPGGPIRRVADTETSWYEYRPFRSGQEGDFVILVVCESAGVEELDVHYHH